MFFYFKNELMTKRFNATDNMKDNMFETDIDDFVHKGNYFEIEVV